MSDFLEEARLGKDRQFRCEIAEGEGVEFLNPVKSEAGRFPKEPGQEGEQDESESEGRDSPEAGMENEIKEQGAESEAERLPLERGKVFEEANQNSDKGCASIFHLLC